MPTPCTYSKPEPTYAKSNFCWVIAVSLPRPAISVWPRPRSAPPPAPWICSRCPSLLQNPRPPLHAAGPGSRRYRARPRRGVSPSERQDLHVKRGMGSKHRRQRGEECRQDVEHRIACCAGVATLLRCLRRRVYSSSTAMTEVRMSGELDPKIGERLVFSAICRLQPTRGDKIL